MQVGTPFLMTSTVSANVADDMAEFEAENPGRWTEERFRSRSSGSSGLFRRSQFLSFPFLFAMLPLSLHVDLGPATCSSGALCGVS